LYFAASAFGASEIGRAIWHQKVAIKERSFSIEGGQMKRRTKASAKRRSIVDPTLEKPLLHLHAATDIDSFWKAVRQVIEAALPGCFIGLTLQHSPILPRVMRSTRKIPADISAVRQLKPISLRIHGRSWSCPVMFSQTSDV